MMSAIEVREVEREVREVVHRGQSLFHSNATPACEKQWNFMQVFSHLDVDFHILDRRDEPMETFVCPSDYDIFIKLKSNAHSNTAQATSRTQ